MNYNRDENFVGFNPVNWWGIVEDRNDPLQSGRLKVRIFGWHSLNPIIAPTELIPWAQVQLSLNSPRSFSGPKIGEWVTGYFIDGAGGQFPIITGVLPGINSELSIIPDDAPRPPPGVVLETADTPSIPPLSRGIVDNSLIAKTNADVVHVCDISLQVRQVVGWLKAKFGFIVTKIREGILAVLKALGLDPTGESSAVVSFLKKIASYIKFINDALEEVLNWREVIFEVARIARALVDWILNLPERLLNLLRECLSSLYSAIAGGFQEILSIGTGGIDTSSAEITSAINEITTGAQFLITQTTDLVSTPVQLVGVLTSPSDPSSVSKVQEYISSQTLNTSQYTSNTFDKNNTQNV